MLQDKIQFNRETGSSVVVLIIIVLLVASLGGYFFFSNQNMSPQGNIADCKTNLDKLIRHTMIYYDTSGTRSAPFFPDDPTKTFQTLLDFSGDRFSPSILVCPLSKNTPATGAKPKIEPDNCSYEMVPWNPDLSGFGGMVYFDKVPHPDGTRCVVNSDTSVQVLKEEDFQRLFKEAKIDSAKPRRGPITLEELEANPQLIEESLGIGSSSTAELNDDK